MMLFVCRKDCWYITPIEKQKIQAYHGVESMDNLIYLIGGYNGIDHFSTVYCFDPVTSIWSEKACMHEPRCYISTCILSNQYVRLFIHYLLVTFKEFKSVRKDNLSVLQSIKALFFPRKVIDGNVLQIRMSCLHST